MNPHAPNLEALGLAGRFRPFDGKQNLEAFEFQPGGGVRVPQAAEIAPIVEREVTGICLVTPVFDIREILAPAIIRSRTENLWINGFAEYRNAEEDQSGAENFDDRLRVVRARLNYNRSGETFFSSALLRVSQGVDVLGASEERAGPLSRFDGHPQFTKVSGELSHAQSIYGGVSAQISAIGQKSANSLLASEEFALGGSRFGRAYDFAEVTGEDGIAGSLELRCSFEDAGDLFESLQFYGFYDMGAVWNRNASGPFRRHSLSSAGVGLRANLPRSIFVSLEAAQPLTRPVETSGGNTHPRYFFSLSVGF